RRAFFERPIERPLSTISNSFRADEKLCSGELTGVPSGCLPMPRSPHLEIEIIRCSGVREALKRFSICGLWVRLQYLAAEDRSDTLRSNPGLTFLDVSDPEEYAWCAGESERSKNDTRQSKCRRVPRRVAPNPDESLLLKTLVGPIAQQVSC